MGLELEWTGTSYSDQIDNLSDALDAATRYCDEYGYDNENLIEAENIFADLAFPEWHTIPDNWSLIPI